MSVRQLQVMLASVFFVLGGWCVVAPASVIALAFRPEVRSAAPIALLLTRGFGSQALISGLFAATARFTRTTFLVYAIGLAPFLAFDAVFYAVRPELTGFGAGCDLAGNLVMLAVCGQGVRIAPRD